MCEKCKQSLCWALILTDVLLASMSEGRAAEVTKSSPEGKQISRSSQLKWKSPVVSWYFCLLKASLVKFPCCLPRAPAEVSGVLQRCRWGALYWMHTCLFPTKHLGSSSPSVPLHQTLLDLAHLFWAPATPVLQLRKKPDLKIWSQKFLRKIYLFAALEDFAHPESVAITKAILL